METESEALPELVLEAEAATRRGSRHERNEDAYLVNIDGGLFVIADGMGGHRDGHVASNAITSMLQRTFVAEAPLEEKITTATRAIENVNATLQAQSFEVPDRDISGSTVVALILGENYACCLWAGDSRLYLFRRKHLFLVSEDHADEDGVLTKAVGSAPSLELDRRVLQVEDGDIFLLCSDGLLKGIGEADLAEVLGRIGEAPADRLLAKAIAGGSADDITFILIWIGLREH